MDLQFETFLDAETRVNRSPIPDQRVHACLYFIAPSGHGLKVGPQFHATVIFVEVERAHFFSPSRALPFKVEPGRARAF